MRTYRRTSTRSPRDWLITFLEHRIGDRRGHPPDPEVAERWRHGRWIMDRYGSGHAAGGERFANPSRNVFLHYVLDLWFQKAWRPKGSGRSSDHHPPCGRLRGSGFQHKRDAERCLRDTSGTAGPVWSRPAPGKDPPRRVRTLCRGEPPETWGGQAGNLRLSRVHAFLHDNPEGPVPAWSQTDRETDESILGAH